LKAGERLRPRLGIRQTETLVMGGSQLLVLRQTSAETKDETVVDREGLNPILASTQGEDLEDRNLWLANQDTQFVR
jgi:hypothetical protein